MPDNCRIFGDATAPADSTTSLRARTRRPAPARQVAPCLRAREPRPQAAVLHELDAYGPLALEEDARGMGVGFHLQVGTRQGRLEKAPRRGPASSVVLG